MPPSATIEINPWQKNGFQISARGARHEGLMLHGYGSSSLEMMGLAVSLAEGLKLRIYIFDLPGHASAFEEAFTAESAIAATRSAAAAIGNAAFVIGHSLGARLALNSGIATAVLLSMPGAAEFDGSREDMLKVLRPQRVNEPAALKSLASILSEDVRPAPRTLVVTASRELKSVRDMASAWRNLKSVSESATPRREQKSEADSAPPWRKQKVEFAVIKDSHHNDIVSSAETLKVIKAWLPANLD